MDSSTSHTNKIQNKSLLVIRKKIFNGGDLNDEINKKKREFSGSKQSFESFVFLA